MIDAFSTATEIAGAIRRRQISASEVVRAHLERIASVNPPINAIVTLDSARAVERAAVADVALARGELWGRPPSLAALSG